MTPARSSARRRASRRARSSCCTAAAPTSTTSSRCSTRSIPERRLHGYTPRAPLVAAAGRRALVRRAARRLSRPGDVRARATTRSTEWFDALPFPAERIVLGGFSQGAVMSYALGLGQGRPRPAALLALSGFIPTVEGWEPDLEPPFPPIAIAHGTYDPVIPVEFGRAARATCSRRRAPTCSTASRRSSTRSTRRRSRAAHAGRARVFGIGSPSPGHQRRRRNAQASSLLSCWPCLRPSPRQARPGRAATRGDVQVLHRPDVPADGVATTSGKITGFDVDMARGARRRRGAARRRRVEDGVPGPDPGARTRRSATP